MSLGGPILIARGCLRSNFWLGWWWWGGANHNFFRAALGHTKKKDKKWPGGAGGEPSAVNKHSKALIFSLSPKNIILEVKFARGRWPSAEFFAFFHCFESQNLILWGLRRVWQGSSGQATGTGRQSAPVSFLKKTTKNNKTPQKNPKSP